MPGSLPWGDPSRTRCLENEAYEAPLRRFGSHMTRVALALTFIPAAGQSPTRGSSTTRARTRPTRRWTTGVGRRSPRRPREARMASSGSLLLGPMTALGLVSLLRLTAGRVRPPSGHRYCSNSFFSTNVRGFCCWRYGGVCGAVGPEYGNLCVFVSGRGRWRDDPNLIEFFLNFELLWIAICSRVKNPACVC